MRHPAALVQVADFSSANLCSVCISRVAFRQNAGGRALNDSGIALIKTKAVLREF